MEPQQQQWYEKESFLVEIDYNRKRLLQKLKEYKGDDNLEVIHEAIAFASSTVEIENNDLLLPPYPNPPFTHKISQKWSPGLVKVRGVCHKNIKDERGMKGGCPPGKVLVVEDGKTRCLVKERVEIAFVSVTTTPDVSYGCGRTSPTTDDQVQWLISFE
ncbi:hypothetical protein L1987_74243 [Smallanthus sonchifolius]|uniref:Uncharacterized protein n=1 Tax=Smallanthus sonchifolius TaxID=185202 RepID=A0ACB9A2H8_9ASTR|nr:hypothetical protein L1987_74243 [Smallanthus sonchifolius]